MDKNELCPVCNKSAKQKCSGCKKIYYCTKEHQRLHWRSHSKNCRAFKLVEDTVLGRHYIATRNINAGEVILHEKKPLLEISTPSVPVCLNCYIELRVDNAKSCKKCGWPLCLSCSSHGGGECELTTKYLKSEEIDKSSFGTIIKTHFIATVLRALALRNKNPEAYRKFMSHEDHLKDANKSQYRHIFSGMRDAAGFVNTFMKPGIVEENEITKILTIIVVNGMRILSPNKHTAVFDQASYFEHSCRANCSITLDAGGILIKAAKPIAKGDHLSIAYTDALRGIAERRNYLSTTKFFDCNCERCSDPTDLGTMSNAIKCTAGNCSGYMIPETFLVPNDEYGDFICRKCNASKSWIEVKNMLKSISVKLDFLDRLDVQKCKRFIKDHMKLLHENHHFIFLAKFYLIYAIGASTTRVFTELCIEGITLCRQLAILAKTLVPGEIQLRGTIASFKSTFLLNCADQTLDRALLLEEAEVALTETCELLRDEPSSTTEGRFAFLARLRLNEILVVK